MRIIFREDTHQYYIENSDKVFDTSVSKVIKSVEPKKDFDKIAGEFVNSKNNKEGWKTKEEVLAAWDKKRDRTANRGTKYHALREQEDRLLGAYYHDKNDLGHEIGFEFEKLRNLEAGIYTELIIPNFNTWTIGKSDRIEIFPDKTFYIEDYKCTEDLQVVPKKYYRKELGYSEYEFLLPPCQHLHNTKFNIYQLQLSMYSLFLEQLGYKFKGGHLELVIFNDKDEIVDKIIHPIKYLKKEVENLLKAYRSKQVLK